ncbi:MAG TPA: TRAP transporter small permease [Candidatus Methylomirabilis sp.]|nr:TRAP transporter small permease [Candidatus Methylomirabilis sp.]HSB78314.1 TRAP transporter small permease [Candidatus Methylomirabilis sp.]
MAKGWLWCERVERALLTIIALMVASVLFSVSAQVLSRMIGVAFLVWTDEVTRVAVVWVTFLGSAVGIRRNSHFVIDLFVRLLPAKAERWARRGIWVAVTLSVLVLVGIGWQLAEIGLQRVYPITRISQTWAWAAVPLGAMLMFAFLLELVVMGRWDRSPDQGRGAT